MAQRSMLEGHQKRSLVACPVSLYTAISHASDSHFGLIDSDTGNPIRTQMVDPETGEVDRETLVRGFEIGNDRYLLLTHEGIEAVRPVSSEAIVPPGAAMLVTTLRPHDEAPGNVAASAHALPPERRRSPASAPAKAAAKPAPAQCQQPARKRAAGR